MPVTHWFAGDAQIDPVGVDNGSDACSTPASTTAKSVISNVDVMFLLTHWIINFFFFLGGGKFIMMLLAGRE